MQVDFCDGSWIDFGEAGQVSQALLHSLALGDIAHEDGDATTLLLEIQGGDIHIENGSILAAVLRLEAVMTFLVQQFLNVTGHLFGGLIGFECT